MTAYQSSSLGRQPSSSEPTSGSGYTQSRDYDHDDDDDGEMTKALELSKKSAEREAKRREENLQR